MNNPLFASATAATAALPAASGTTLLATGNGTIGGRVTNDDRGSLNDVPYPLTEDSVRAQQPANATIPLKPHQLALLHRCSEFERGHITQPERDGFPALTLNTQMGVMGDSAGSGKSYVILSLALNTAGQSPSEVQPNVTNLIRGRISLFMARPQPALNLALTVVVMPHTIFRQWQEYAAVFSPTLRTMGIFQRANLARLHNLEELRTVDLLLVTNSMYHDVSSILGSMSVRIRRLVYDEADTLRLKSTVRDVDAEFVWYVTASYTNLVYPRGILNVMYNIGGYNSRSYHHHQMGGGADARLFYGVRSPGPVRDVFLELSNSREVTRALVLRSTNLFVSSSTSMPTPHLHHVRCLTPGSLRMLHGIADQAVIQCLNAGDVHGAMQHIDPSNRTSSEDNLIILMLDRISRMARTVSARLALVPTLEYDTPAERDAESGRLTRKLEELQRTTDNIRQRIVSADICCICCDAIRHKAVTPCCSNAFCFACITHWTTRKPICPLCKEPLTTKELLVVDEHAPPPHPDGGGTSSAAAPASRDPPSDPHALCAWLLARSAGSGSGSGSVSTHSKLQTLADIVQARRQSPQGSGIKLLIFSGNDNTFVDVTTVLNRLGVNHAQLKGNGRAVQNVTEGYKSGTIDALLVNSTFYGSGLNLENTTDIILFHKFDSDIEHQVIGRAMRLGRTAPLHVWYLLYDHEMHHQTATTSPTPALAPAPTQLTVPITPLPQLNTTPAATTSSYSRNN